MKGWLKKIPIVSPRVKVITYYGTVGKGSVQHATKVVDRNRFNPSWDDEGVTFNVASPSIAIALFSGMLMKIQRKIILLLHRQLLLVVSDKGFKTLSCSMPIDLVVVCIDLLICL